MREFRRPHSSPGFGGAIAHGFLVMSLLPSMAKDVDLALEGLVTGVNYGFDKLRMVSPVRAGKRIRGRFVLQDFTEKGPGQWLSTLAVTVEIEGEARRLNGKQRPIAVPYLQTLTFSGAGWVPV